MSSYTRLASALRRWDSARTLVDSPDVLAEARKPTAVRRARVFFAGALEWVARTLAGLCLEHGRTRDGTLDLSRNRLFTLATTDGARRWVLGTPTDDGRRSIEFSLVLIGNGWGFGELIRDGTHSVEALVAQRVRIRLLELLRESPLTPQITDGAVSLSSALDDDARAPLVIDVACEPVRNGHRKARVARGLLEAQDRPQGAQGFETRANGRHGVLGFDLRVTDAGRTVPWFRPFGPPPPERPELIAAPIDEPAPTAPRPATPRPDTPRAAGGWSPFAPTAPAGWSPFAASAPAVGGTLESFVWLLTQQWPQIVAAAAQNGIAPFEYASRQLWGQVLAAAQTQGVPPEQWLAMQRWEQLRMPGANDSVTWAAIAARAAEAQRTPEAMLAAERWDQLVSTLAKSVPLALGPLPPPPPFSTDPNPRR
jgi:hypothetical protein